ncbi:MAG: ATP-dependent Clp protease ATP-binding subunit, partial [Butyrivibrio sp.]|nr:ATP-dependent Clp protease ATP-binding subunit [Butyrivibrio sp.]
MNTNRFTDKAQEALRHAREIVRELKINYIGTEHLMLGLLRTKGSVASRILKDNGVEEDRIMNMIRDLMVHDGTMATMEPDGLSPRAEKVLEEAHRQASRFKAEKTGTEHILLALIREGENVALRLVSTMNVPVQKIYAETLAAMGQDPSLVKEDLKAHKNGHKKGSALARYSRDLTALAAEGKLDPVIGRTDEIQRAIQILSRRTKNNPCLIGEPGVGKTSVVE